MYGRVLLAGTGLLGTDPSPQFTSQVASGLTTPFSFAVFGDWGQAYAGGMNACLPCRAPPILRQAYAGGMNVDQTNVMQQTGSGGARFAVMTGATGYPGGGQKSTATSSGRGPT
jgi:hypothetical protein